MTSDYKVLNKQPVEITMPYFTDEVIDNVYLDLICVRDMLIVNNLCKRGEGLVKVCDTVLRRLVTNDLLERGMCKSLTLKERSEHLNCVLEETGWSVNELVHNRIKQVTESVLF